MLYLLAFLTSLILALYLSPKAILVSRRWGLMDQPDERKKHGEPVPLAGGLLLFPFVLTGTLFILPEKGLVPYVLAGATLIFLLGLWDDRFGAHFSTKFLVQVVAALLVMQSGLLFDLNTMTVFRGSGIQIGHFLSTGTTLLWIVGITNAVNIIDGMDGLAAGLCFNAVAGMAALAIVGGSSGTGMLCMVMGGALIGFLRHNIHPARTFLGDSGSMLLGFTLAVLSVYQSTKTATFLVLVVPVLLLALPMVDTLFAFARRGIRGQNPFRADRGHLHHRLLDLNFTQRQTLGIFFSLSTSLGLLALWLAQTRQLNVVAGAIAILILVLGSVKTMQIYNFHEVVQKLNRRMREVAKRAIDHERHREELLERNLVTLAVLCSANFILSLLSHGGSPVLTLAAVGAFAVGLVDMVTGRPEPERRYEMLHFVLFLTLLVNQIGVLVTWHRHYLVEPHYAIASFIVLALIAVFVFRTGTFAVFLQDPMEILALFTGICVCGIAKHFLGASTMLPFVVALVNALVLYIVLKVALAGYRLRSRSYSIGLLACFLVLVTVPWWQ